MIDKTNEKWISVLKSIENSTTQLSYETWFAPLVMKSIDLDKNISRPAEFITLSEFFIKNEELNEFRLEVGMRYDEYLYATEKRSISYNCRLA